MGVSDTSIDFDTNIVGTKTVLEAVKSNKRVRQLIFTSTSTVYGEPTQIPTPESYGPLKPISLYGGSKLACEALVSAYASLFGFGATIFRLANVVGPDSTHGVVYDFIQKLRKDPTKLEILGDGKQNKSYLWVEDCLQGFFVGSTATTRDVEIFNLGSRDQISVTAIARIVEQEMNIHDVEHVFVNSRGDGRGWAGDVKEMFLDSAKLMEIGWEPRFSSAESVRKAARKLLDKDI